MATFNVTDDGLQHCTRAVQAALAIRDKATLADLSVGTGVAVGPTVGDRFADPDAKLSVLGQTTNLAARLQASAAAGEVVLSADCFCRVADWLSQRGLAAPVRTLPRKGIEGPLTAHVLGATCAPAANASLTSGRTDALSEREQEIVLLLAEGFTDAQIAERLYLSVNTVRSHLDRIRDKTGLRRRVELARLATSGKQRLARADGGCERMGGS